MKNVLTTGRKGDILNKLLRQDAAAGRIPVRLKRTSKKCLTSPGESGKIYKSSQDGMAFEN